jgi:hypothetical protein
MDKKNHQVSLILLVISMVFTLSCPTFANGAFIGEDSTIAPVGRWEIESNFIWTKNNQNMSKYKEYGGYFRFERGIKEDISLSLITPFIKVEPNGLSDESGIGDCNFIVKKKLSTKSKGEDLAIYMNIKLPTGDEEKSLLLGTGETDYGVGVSYQHKEEDTLYRFSTGYTVVGDPDNIDFNDRFNYSFGIEKMTDRGIIVLGEVYGESRQSEASDDSIIVFTVGAKKRIRKNRVFHFAISFGGTNETPDVRLNSGVKFSF